MLEMAAFSLMEEDIYQIEKGIGFMEDIWLEVWKEDECNTKGIVIWVALHEESLKVGAQGPYALSNGGTIIVVLVMLDIIDPRCLEGSYWIV